MIAIINFILPGLTYVALAIAFYVILFIVCALYTKAIQYVDGFGGDMANIFYYIFGRFDAIKDVTWLW